MELEDAVNKALSEMPGDFEIKRYLIEHKAEVTGMLYKEYDEAEVMEMMRRDAKEEGIEQGIEQKGREDIIRLARYQRSLDPGMSEEEAIESAERILGGQK